MQGEARLDQDPEQGTVLFMEGQVRDANGAPIPGAVVDVWHANTKGGYSFFDPSQSAWNLRRRIETDGDGRYLLNMAEQVLGLPDGAPLDAAGLAQAVGRRASKPIAATVTVSHSTSAS